MVQQRQPHKTHPQNLAILHKKQARLPLVCSIKNSSVTKSEKTHRKLVLNVKKSLDIVLEFFHTISVKET
jgi:hypothetical protein